MKDRCYCYYCNPAILAGFKCYWKLQSDKLNVSAFTDFYIFFVVNDVKNHLLIETMYKEST